MTHLVQASVHHACEAVAQTGAGIFRTALLVTSEATDGVEFQPVLVRSSG